MVTEFRNYYRATELTFLHNGIVGHNVMGVKVYACMVMVITLFGHKEGPRLVIM